jgi:hypothetical protein
MVDRLNGRFISCLILSCFVSAVQAEECPEAPFHKVSKEALTFFEKKDFGCCDDENNLALGVTVYSDSQTFHLREGSSCDVFQTASPTKKTLKVEGAFLLGGTSSNKLSCEMKEDIVGLPSWVSCLSEEKIESLNEVLVCQDDIMYLKGSQALPYFTGKASCCSDGNLSIGVCITSSVDGEPNTFFDVGAPCSNFEAPTRKYNRLSKDFYGVVKNVASCTPPCQDIVDAGIPRGGVIACRD